MSPVVTAPRTVFITGAARGIGRAAALAFALNGDSVFLVDICRPIDGWSYPLATEADLRDSADACLAEHRRVDWVIADVRSDSDVSDAVARCREMLGPVDILVNCAGIIGPVAANAHELTDQAWQTVVDVNLTGTWRCAKAALPDMIERRAGCVTNISSTAGLVAFPLFASYVAAKHGIIGLTRALAVEYGSFGIRANAICPTSVYGTPGEPVSMLQGVAAMLGMTLSEYESLSVRNHPIGKLVLASDVAALAVWLSSAAAVHMSGAVIPVDAAFTAR